MYKQGTCGSTTDRKSIAFGFFPHENTVNSFKYLENYIACGFPCFLDNREMEKNLLSCLGKGLCEANNEMYELLQISTRECAHCAMNFISKSYVDPEIIQCLEKKNKEANLLDLSVDMGMACYDCQEYLIEGTFKIFIPII